MWLASSSISSTSLTLIYCSTSTSISSSMKLYHSFRICVQYGYWFGGKLIQKLQQKEIDKESCLKTCTNAKNPKLYSAYELCDENVQLHVFDYEETLEDAGKSRLKMQEYWFGGKLIQKLGQKEIDEESCLKTYSMNWREVNSVYTYYIVSSESKGEIQAGALIFVLVGYIVTNAKNLKLYSAYELCDENVQLHVFDSEETLEDAGKSRLKMKEFQKDESVQYGYETISQF
ncbi:hypothetical protein Tco_1110140 [Tanacetum coccineum]|uniref:Uncharacterized protein n=1 Tax=Tanacetum coccineum TaxID=301880 RepID=A0ABQ5II04_9ASTR